MSRSALLITRNNCGISGSQSALTHTISNVSIKRNGRRGEKNMSNSTSLGVWEAAGLLILNVLFMWRISPCGVCFTQILPNLGRLATRCLLVPSRESGNDPYKPSLVASFNGVPFWFIARSFATYRTSKKMRMFVFIGVLFVVLVKNRWRFLVYLVV